MLVETFTIEGKQIEKRRTVVASQKRKNSVDRITCSENVTLVETLNSDTGNHRYFLHYRSDREGAGCEGVYLVSYTGEISEAKAKKILSATSEEVLVIEIADPDTSGMMHDTITANVVKKVKVDECYYNAIAILPFSNERTQL